MRIRFRFTVDLRYWIFPKYYAHIENPCPPTKEARLLVACKKMLPDDTSSRRRISFRECYQSYQWCFCTPGVLFSNNENVLSLVSFIRFAGNCKLWIANFWYESKKYKKIIDVFVLYEFPLLKWLFQYSHTYSTLYLFLLRSKKMSTTFATATK